MPKLYDVSVKFSMLLFIFSWPMLSNANSSPVLRISGYSWEPFLYVSKPNEYNEPLLKGIDIDLVRIVAKKLDFDMTFHWSSTWGSLNKNGIWSGTIGEVVRGEADVGLGQLSIIHSRFKYVDYSIAIYFPQNILLSQKPLPLPQHFNLVKPFSPSIWVLTVTALLTSILMKLLLVIQESVTCSWSDTINHSLKLVGSLISQGKAGIKIHQHSSLIFALSWLIFTTILGMAYECNLRAYLINVDHEPAINTAEDVITLERDFYFAPGSNLMAISKSEGTSHFTTMVKRAINKKHFFNLSNGTFSPKFLMELYNNRSVMLLSREEFGPLAKKAEKLFGENPFRVGNEPQLIDYCGFVFPKGSRWLAGFNSVLMHLVESGISVKLMSEYRLVGNDKTSSNSNDIPLNMDHIVVPAGVLSVGLGISVLIFAVEMYSFSN